MVGQNLRGVGELFVYSKLESAKTPKLPLSLSLSRVERPLAGQTINFPVYIVAKHDGGDLIIGGNCPGSRMGHRRGRG